MNIIDIIISIIRQFPTDSIKSIISIFRRITASRTRTLISFTILLVLLGVFFTKYYQRSSRYEAIISSTLSADLMSTAQRYKGLESFIMSMINVDPNIQESIGNLGITDKFHDGLEALRDKIAQYKRYKDLKSDSQVKCRVLTENTESCTNAKQIVAKYSKENEITEGINLKIKIASGSIDGMTLTDDDPNGFLFFPIHILRPPINLEYRRKLTSYALSDKNKAIDELRSWTLAKIRRNTSLR